MTLTALVDLLLPILKCLGGRWLTAPLDVFVPEADSVQPDLLVLLPDSRAQLARREVEGQLDLHIEVLSPSNRAHDQIRKRELYARAGVRQYWIVDQRSGCSR